MIALPEFETMQVCGTWLYCVLLKPAEKTKGGIWLPDIARQNLTHAKILRAGPGLARVHKQEEFDEGMQVIFPKHAAVPVTKDTVQVRQEDVIATLWEDEESDETCLIPENDFLMIERTAAEEKSKGGVVLPETSRRAARSGRIVDAGPGELRLEGPLKGTRRSVRDIMNWPEDCNLRDAVIYWGPGAEAVQVENAGEAFWFVRAADLLLAEVPD